MYTNTSTVYTYTVHSMGAYSLLVVVLFLSFGTWLDSLQRERERQGGAYIDWADMTNDTEVELACFYSAYTSLYLAVSAACRIVNFQLFSTAVAIETRSYMEKCG